MHSDQHSAHKEIMIVAGEASGDLHGAHMVKSMSRLDPTLRFYGVGGEKLREAGVDIVAETSEMAVVGLTEVLSKIGFVLNVHRKLKRSFNEDRPDLVILIDYPDFNLPLAKAAHKSGIKVFYYISPQVWAWRKRRIYKISRYVDRMAVILPFEPAVYENVDLDVTFVGHPLLDVVKQNYSHEEALIRFGLNNGITTVGILPGSRRNEIVSLLPDMLEAACILRKKLSSVQFILPLADTLDHDFVSGIVSRYPIDVKIIRDNVYDVIAVSDIAMVASGTATLETALIGTPMIVVYKVSPISYYLGKLLVGVDNIALVNIIAGRGIVPELIQHEVTAEAMAHEIYRMLGDKVRMKTIRQDLRAIKDRLGTPGAADRTAQLAYELL